jgi:hypothetical protein
MDYFECPVGPVKLQKAIGALLDDETDVSMEFTAS